MPRAIHRPRLSPKAAKFLLLTAAVVCLLVACLMSLIHSKSNEYISDVFVQMKPFTNSILESSFERKLKETMPGISELHFQRAVVSSNRLGVATTNTHVYIQITATGNSATEAIRNANEIAPEFCTVVGAMFTNASVSILNPAVGAGERRAANSLATVFLRKHTILEPTKVVGEVAFVNTGVRLTPGPEWEQHYSTTPNPPSLIRREKKGDQFLFINLTGDHYADDLLPPGAQSFTSQSGVFITKTTHPQTGPNPGQRTDYVTTNAGGQVIRITHIAVPINQTNEVERMILETLRVEPP